MKHLGAIIINAHKILYISIGVEGMNSYMENINHIGLLEIKASCNDFYLGEEIQLIALRESIYGIQEIQNVKWKIDYIGDEIILKNSVIRISSSLKDIKYLKVTCEDRDTGDI